MKTIVALLTAFLLLVSGSPAIAQSASDLGNLLKDVLGGKVAEKGTTEYQSWHGHLVQATGTTMIFRAEDGKIYAVDMSAISAQSWQPMALGQALTLAAKPGPQAQTLVAVRIDPEQPDRAGHLRQNRPFRTVHGTVQRVEGSQVTVRGSDGTVIPVDVSRMTGEAEFRANDGAAVILEPGSGNAVVWMEREDRQRGARGDRGDILSGLSGEYQRLHGDRLHASGTTMIVKADDGRTYVVDMSAVNSQTWRPIELGQAVTLAAKPGREPNTLIAARLQADPADRSTGKAPKKPFMSAQGTVEAVRGSQFRFKTTDGKNLWADASQMPGPSAARVNDQGTLIYRAGSRGQQVSALWLERQEAQPAAAVAPRAVSPGEYKRLYGYVQSVGSSTLSFKTDDGRILTVDTRQVDAQVRSTVRQGDLVSILGKTTERADQFVAELIERETRR